MPFADYTSMEECTEANSGKADPAAYCAKVHYEVTGEWPSEKYKERFGEDAVISTPIEAAELAVEKGDVPRGTWGQIDSDSLTPLRRYAASETDARRFKSAIDMVKLSKEDGVSDALEKADRVEKVGFDAQVNRSVSMVFKQDDEFLIWGPASVEIVDKEQDKVNVEALDKALPQLLKRASLSYAHTDQLVGRILERFETDEEIEVEIDGKTYKRSSFPTDVLDLDDGEPPGMFVAGEVFDDTNQARDVRKKIEEGIIDSYSISGEALVTQKQVDGNMVYDDILEMDLSAVTLCEEGMNQGAKFARIDGEVENVELASAEKAKSDDSYTVENGPVSSPQQVAATVSKSMTGENKSSEQEKGEVDFDPEEYLKRDEVEGSIATKEDINEALEETVDKTVEAVTKELEGDIPSDEDIQEKATEAVKSQLPDGDLATVGYINENFVRQDEEEEDEDDYEEEEKEDHGDDEDRDKDEYEDKSPEGEEQLSRDQLKQDLPEDVWKVVSEYLPDTKAEKSNGEGEDDSEYDQLEKAVEEVINSGAVQSPGTDLADRENELEKRFEDDEGGAEESSSPALHNWR